MKRKLILVLAVSLVALITGGTLAMASSGKLTEVEQKWLEFRKAVANQQVKDGILTRQQADNLIADLQKKLEPEGDTVYEKFAKRFSLDDKGKHQRGKEGAIIRLYAELTGRNVSDVAAACKKNNISLWELARREKRADELKTRVLKLAESNLNSKVSDGTLTVQQRDAALKKISDALASPEPNLEGSGIGMPGCPRCEHS
jgi:polyhydroxyalkanoate synthesis regulator phasin